MGWCPHAPRKSAQQAGTISRTTTRPLGCQWVRLSSWEISQSNGLNQLSWDRPHRWPAGMRMDPRPAHSLQFCMGFLPSRHSLYFFSSTQATTPANLVAFNEQRDNPVKLCPPVLCGHKPRGSGQQALLTSLSFSSPLSPAPSSFFGKRYQRTQSPRPQTTHSRLKAADHPYEKTGP